MKKYLALILSMLLFYLTLPVCFAQNGNIVLYNENGNAASLSPSSADKYLKNDWYTSSDNITITMYSLDKRTIQVLKSQADEYNKVGWYYSIDDVSTIMYSMDGRTLRVYNDEIELYKAVGWYPSLSDVTITMYSMDGRTLTVFKDEIELYKAVGWYDSIDDVITTMYSADGRSIQVYKSLIPAYQLVGWYTCRPGIDPSAPMVALTFDDGPSSTHTNRILDVLERYNARATFFVLGNRVIANADTIKRAYNLGMEIGNHSYSHPSLTSLSQNDVALQVVSTNTAVNSIIGVDPALLRPPYGSYNNAVKSIINMPLILWSIDTLDWKTRDADATYNAVLSKVKDGDIILMHDIYKQTADAAEKIIPALINRGYQLVTVSELSQYKGMPLLNQKVYHSVR